MLTPLPLIVAVAFCLQPPPHQDSASLLQHAIDHHASIPAARLTITTRHNPRHTTKAYFSFTRTADLPSPPSFRFERWRGKGGPLDLVCDGKRLAFSNPIRRSWRHQPAPSSFAALVQDRSLAAELGVGPALLLNWLSEGGAVFEPDSIPRSTRHGDRAAYTIEGFAPGPAGRTRVSFSFAAAGPPLLLGAELPMTDGTLLSIAFDDWNLTSQPPSAFALQPPQPPGASAQSLVGSLAPQLPTTTGSGGVRIVLFWSDTSSMDRQAKRDFDAIHPALEALGATPLAIHLDRERISRSLRADPRQTSTAWHLNGEPTYALIDSKGFIRGVQVGHPGREALEARLGAAARKLTGIVAAAAN